MTTSKQSKILLEELQICVPRESSVSRITKETQIELTLNLDGHGRGVVSTGIGFLDHMILSLTRHARFDLSLTCQGDIHIDDHHTAEDCALALGQALREALDDRRGLKRFGAAYAPLDEALTRAVVDLSGRPWPAINLGFRRESLGQIATENITHFFQSLAMEARMNLHVCVLEGENDHHRAESAFKATALALRTAVSRDDHSDIPSEKEVLA